LAALARLRVRLDLGVGAWNAWALSLSHGEPGIGSDKLGVGQ
jgi:hypothetical protein